MNPGLRRPLTQLCCLVAVLVVGAARPNAEVSQRDARAQTVLDTSDPLEKPRSMPLSEEVYKGGVVPVALVYDQPEDLEVKRPLRETAANNHEAEQSDVREETQTSNELKEQDDKSAVKNSKLLSLEARQTEDDISLGIQSRNKVSSEEEESEELLKPFVYNIQPLSYYSANTKDEQSILNYINKIKEIRESQIKQDEEKKLVEQKHEEAVVTESEDSESGEEEGPIRRKIQHYQTLIKPIMMDPQMYGGVPPNAYPVYPASTMGVEGLYNQPYQQQPSYQQLYQHPYQQQLPYQQVHQQLPYQQPFPQLYQPQPTIIYLPNPFKAEKTSQQNTKSGNTRIFDDYFPIVFNNPFNEIWAGITNIVEYGPAADVCRSNKKGRVDDEDSDTIIDIPASRRRISFRPGVRPSASKGDNSWPNIARLKVRRGGVAIAGPGGIATAGSGGTAIVGPGGTAYTTREGTAVVGPGGRVVHVPEFPIYAKNVEDTPKEFVPPAGSRVVAEGPIVYHDTPLDQDDIPDPTIPI